MLVNSAILLLSKNRSEGLKLALESVEFEVTHLEHEVGDFESFDTLSFDAIVMVADFPDEGVLAFIEKLRLHQPHLPLILIAEQHNSRIAIEATKRGAYDFLLKPVEISEFIELIRKTVDTKRMMANRVELGNQEADQDAIIGTSRSMLQVYKNIGRVAAKPIDILIQGETGTGKELVARAIYQFSGRSNKSFIAVNCAAIPETLLESELFGHEKGAFTGATERRIGRFEQSHEGTLFLDEIGELSLATQSKILRVLQERQIQRLGADQLIKIDTRIIFASNRDLEEEVREQRFRRDLFYRLNSAMITLPPLRERAEDIPDLVEFFVRKHGVELAIEKPAITADAIDYLQDKIWLGNVRELENYVRKALLAARGFTITVDDLTSLVSVSPNAPVPLKLSVSDYVSNLVISAKNGEGDRVHAQAIEFIERETLAQTLNIAEGNQAKAARWLGLSRPTLKDKLMSYGLHPSQVCL